MSLIKQLWIGIIIMLLLALGGSFAISLMSAKHYLEEQLRVKNMDNAASLALSMSQMEKDEVNFELLISAQFDTGHYEYIILMNPHKQTVISRKYENNDKNANHAVAPDWFVRLVNFDANPGVAQVQDGWQQYGTLLVKSQSSYAVQALWDSATQLLSWFVIASLLSGLVGTVILKFISSPLDIVIRQAEAIGERRFVTSDEPKTIEFQRLVRAMNSLSHSVKVMLEKETRQLEKLRRETQLDSLTELPNRSHFLNLLESKLNREDSENNGVIGIARVLNLIELNNHVGRAATDHALLQIAGVLHQFISRYPGSSAGRLNGSDFMLVVPGEFSAETIGAEFSEQLNSQMDANDISNIQLPVAACNYHLGEKRNELLHKLDGALAQAELKGNRALITLDETNLKIIHRNLNDWREAITDALDKKKLQLASFPVKQSNGDVLHFESPLRLFIDGEWQPAGYFMPWAARLGIMPFIDLEVVKSALEKLQDTHNPIAINISSEALCNAAFREQVLLVLNAAPHLTKYLWLEFPEACALRHMAELRNFAISLRTVGCHVGLEHVGLEFTKIRELQDIGLHYLKIDGAITRDIDNNLGTQTFLHGLCKIGHSLGMSVIAEGINTAAEKETIFKLGLDALTGPGV